MAADFPKGTETIVTFKIVMKRKPKLLLENIRILEACLMQQKLA